MILGLKEGFSKAKAASLALICLLAICFSLSQKFFERGYLNKCALIMGDIERKVMNSLRRNKDYDGANRAAVRAGWALPFEMWVFTNPRYPSFEKPLKFKDYSRSRSHPRERLRIPEISHSRSFSRDYSYRSRCWSRAGFEEPYRKEFFSRLFFMSLNGLIVPTPQVRPNEY